MIWRDSGIIYIPTKWGELIDIFRQPNTSTAATAEPSPPIISFRQHPRSIFPVSRLVFSSLVNWQMISKSRLPTHTLLFSQELHCIIKTQVQLCGSSRQRTPFLSPNYPLSNHLLDCSKPGAFLADHQSPTWSGRAATHPALSCYCIVCL